MVYIIASSITRSGICYLQRFPEGHWSPDKIGPFRGAPRPGKRFRKGNIRYECRFCKYAFCIYRIAGACLFDEVVVTIYYKMPRASMPVISPEKVENAV